jgi:stress response protein SCP2
MKKMIKMSLVAAVAVAGLTTTASAVAMEDAIKNTDLSGYVRYRYTNGEANLESNEYRVSFTTKSKVNDNVTAKIKVGGKASTTDASGDVNPDLTGFAEANFIINTGGATIIAGKQANPTPFADPSDQTGTGAVVLYPVSDALTIGAGWFTNTDSLAYQGAALTGNNIGAVAAIGKVAAINYALWYASISENGGAVAGAGATAYNGNIGANFGPASIEVNHASVNYTGTVGDTLNDQSQSRLVVSAEAGPATVTLGYVKTGKDGGNVTLGDTDASANFAVENISASALVDGTAYYVGLSGKVGAIKLGFDYVTGDGTNLDTATEMKVSACYEMSKNFKVSGFLTDGETKSLTNGVVGAAVPNDMSRVEIKYTF